MYRLIWEEPAAEEPTDSASGGGKFKEGGRGIVGPSFVSRALLERIPFVSGPRPIERPLSDEDGPAQTVLYHGLVEDHEAAWEAYGILETFERATEVITYAVESDVRPPPPLPRWPLTNKIRSWKAKLFGESLSQEYLEDPPLGVGARHAWTFAGGRGAGVRLIDIEIGFDCRHEDLRRAARNSPLAPSHAHGTVRLGVCCADENRYGITGIAPEAEPELYGVIDKATFPYEYPLVSNAIWDCAKRLCAGDVILLELQAKYVTPGKTASNFLTTKILPVERSPDVAAAIRDAIKKDIYIVEAAGNGGEDLDRVLGLPVDTGAILVGASRNNKRVWKWGTNHGKRVNVHGWGESVVSTATKKSKNAICRTIGNPTWTRCYTRQFDGTSSASAMVAGVVACLSGYAQANGHGTLSPQKLRDHLVRTGTAHVGTKEIGSLPNLVVAIREL